jgi:hypothetical protein
VCGIDGLACQDDLFVNNPLNVKESEEHALDFALHLSHLFGLGVFEHAIQTSVYGSCFLPQMLV